MKFIDSHAHIYAKDFNTDINKALADAKQNGIEKIVMPNIDLESIDGMHSLADNFPEMCFASMGLHPCSAKADYKNVLAEMKKHLDKRNYVAIGETGLDYHWDTTFKSEQQAALIEQINWANERELPIILHTRAAFEDTYHIIKKHKSEKLTGVFHCFGDGIADAKKVFDLGFYIGIGGVLTFKNAGLDKTMQQLDLDKVILETDSPYLAPKPFRGKRNEPAYIKLIAEKLAEVKNLEVSEIAKITSSNSEQLFKI